MLYLKSGMVGPKIKKFFNSDHYVLNIYIIFTNSLNSTFFRGKGWVIQSFLSLFFDFSYTNISYILYCYFDTTLHSTELDL